MRSFGLALDQGKDFLCLVDEQQHLFARRQDRLGGFHQAALIAFQHTE